MSEPISSENPVVLFGDIGPDVVKFSQIYDPDSDEFSLSKDELAIEGKTYYTRSYSDKTVSFTELNGVVPGVDTPEANDWYEPNIDGTVSTGKYVPAEKSLVVVDVATEEYKERTILIVESVDSVTLKSKLVPHNCGAEDATTARALKYGNGDYQLYFEEQSVSTPDRKVVLTPDRKLMLYGCRYYMYMLRRNGKVISTPVPESIATSENGLVPYISPTSKRVTITGNNATASSFYGNYAGCSFDTLCGTRFNSITVPAAPIAAGDAHPFIPTFDAVYRSSPVGPYWLFEAAHYELTKDTIYSGTKAYYIRSTTTPYTYTLKTVTAGTAVEPDTYEYVDDRYTEILECVYELTRDEEFRTGTTYYKRNPLNGCYTKTTASAYPTGSKPVDLGLYNQITTVMEPDPGEVKYYFTANTVVGYLIKVEHGVSDPGYTQYAAVQIQQTADKAFNTGVLGWIRDVATATAAKGLSYTDESHVYYPDSCYLKAGFSIVSGETVDMEVYELRENSTDLRMVMNVTLTTKEGMILDGTDAKSKKITYLDANLDGNTSDIWYIKTNETVAKFTERIKPYLTFDDGSTQSLDLDTPGLYIYGLESINTMPNTGKQFRILFKYFPNSSVNPNQLNYINSNSSKNFLSCTKVVQAADGADTTIRKISLLPVWDHRPESATHNLYSFKYLVYRTDFKSPAILDNLGSLLVNTVTDGRASTDVFVGNACDVTDAKYLDDSGIVRPSSTPTELFGYIQHANIGLYAMADGYVNAEYTQKIALQIQNWEITNIPIKWLIGDNTDSWEASLMPYGNPNAGIRPYIEFNGAVAEQESATDITRPFQVGLKFSGSRTDFLNSFYYNANPPGAAVNVNVNSQVTPNNFLCRTFMTRDDYQCITDTTDPTKDVALEELKDCYYNVATGKKVNVTVGVTLVGDYKVKVLGDVDFYTLDGTVWTKAELEVGSFIEKSQKKNYFLKHVVEINSGYVGIGTNETSSGSEGWCVPFSLYGAYMSKEKDDRFGGAIPFVFGNEDNDSNAYNTQCMGTVIMEFVDVDNDNNYQHLYGVPVEVRHPYTPTNDPKYVAGKTYYVYGYSNAYEDSVPVFDPAISVAIKGVTPRNRFFKMINIAADAEITNTPLAVWEAY